MITKSIAARMKALAIIMVVLGHILAGYYDANTYLCIILGTGGVFVFFFLSGYGLAWSWMTNGITKDYWNHKIRKVMVPYWIVTLIWILVRGLYVLHPDILLKSFFFVDYESTLDNTMWYLSLLMIWYVVFWILFRFEYSVWIKLLLLFVIACWLYLSTQSELFLYDSYQFSHNAFGFPLGVVMGIVCFKLAKRRIQNTTRYVLLIVTILVCAGEITWFYSVQTDSRLFTQINGLFVFFFLFAICSLVEKIRPFARMLEWIGAESYLVYLLEFKWFLLLGTLGIMSSFWLTVLYFGSFAALIALVVVAKRLGKRAIPAWKHDTLP